MGTTPFKGVQRNVIRMWMCMDNIPRRMLKGGQTHPEAQWGGGHSSAKVTDDLNSIPANMISLF
jgi:hypothetical protein